MIKVVLTGKKKGYALIDDEDFDRVSKYKWHQNWNGYPVTSLWDKKNQVRRKMWLHRFIMQAPEDKEVDHINFDKLDVRKENLRLCTHAENNRNQKLKRTNKTGFRGVSIRKGRTKPYMAHIRSNGKTYYLGYYETPKEASEAYQTASKELHGEFGSDGIESNKFKKYIPSKPIIYLPKNNTSGFRGINYNERNKVWMVRLTIDGKRKLIGNHKTKKEAIKALRDYKKQNNL